jgi:serine/threonine protein phosphatase PrpC
MQNVIETAREQAPAREERARRVLRMTSHGLTDPGRVRPVNEDQFAIAEVRRVMRVLQSSISQPETLLGDQLGHFLVVADGIGGHRGGDYASAMAVMGIENLLLNTIGWLCRLQGEGVLGELHQALRIADQWVEEAAGRQPELHGMGTTLTMAYVTGSTLYVAHVGDSRCYLWRQGRLERLTRDHTYVESLVQGGVLTPEQAANHNLRNVVTNAVGGGTSGVQPEVHKHPLAGGDVILLCTDGLTGMVPDDELSAILARESSPEAACRRMIDQANARGGQDNITTVVARLDDAGAPGPAA